MNYYEMFSRSLIGYCYNFKAICIINYTAAAICENGYRSQMVCLLTIYRRYGILQSQGKPKDQVVT